MAEVTVNLKNICTKFKNEEKRVVENCLFCLAMKTNSMKIFRCNALQLRPHEGSSSFRLAVRCGYTTARRFFL